MALGAILMPKLMATVYGKLTPGSMLIGFRIASQVLYVIYMMAVESFGAK